MKSLLRPGARLRRGVEIIDMSQSEFDAYVRADFDKWRRVAREGNIVVE